MNNDEKPYQNLIGLTEKEAVAILEKENVDIRVMTPGMAYTLEYCDNRVNISLNKEGQVVRVHIG